MSDLNHEKSSNSNASTAIRNRRISPLNEGYDSGGWSSDAGAADISVAHFMGAHAKQRYERTHLVLSQIDGDIANEVVDLVGSDPEKVRRIVQIQRWFRIRIARLRYVHKLFKEVKKQEKAIRKRNNEFVNETLDMLEEMEHEKQRQDEQILQKEKKKEEHRKAGFIQAWFKWRKYIKKKTNRKYEISDISQYDDENEDQQGQQAHAGLNNYNNDITEEEAGNKVMLRQGSTNSLWVLERDDEDVEIEDPEAKALFEQLKRQETERREKEGRMIDETMNLLEQLERQASDPFAMERALEREETENKLKLLNGET